MEDNIKMDIIEVICERAKGMGLSVDRAQWYDEAARIRTG